MKRRVKLGDIEFTVVEEEKPRDMVTITDHQVEKGQDVSDHVKQESSIIDLVGVMIGDSASTNLSKLKKYQREGKVLSYIGRNAYNNMVIQTIDRNHSKNISNGFEFNIVLKQVRISTAKAVELRVVSPVVKSASTTPRKPDPKTSTQVKKKTNGGKQQVKKKSTQGPPKKPVQDANVQIKKLGIYQGGIQEQATSYINLTKIRNAYKKPQDRTLGIYKGGIF